jgi:hypothetical protein
MPKMVLNDLSLSEVELLQFVAPNLCGFDPGLEAIISNLLISLVPYLKEGHCILFFLS